MKLMSGAAGGMHANRLIHEKSPYLLQHAHNPVHWHPWCDDAFERARAENKPIFLSIGYSTCHWCHVMERESFENDVIAGLLNRHFVSIKVDREERPDIDRVYMAFVQATTGSGGWPMSVFLTPERKPFFGGTYFPPQTRWGHPGFAEVLERVAEAWRLDRSAIIDSSGDVLDQLRAHTEALPAVTGAKPVVLDSGFYSFRRIFDTKDGGFGGAPKFPRIAVHNFLMRYWARTQNVEALEMVFATLNAMAHGGIRDQLGGGFHRYAVDGRWFVPHFEKMLYDQAQIAVSYLEAFQVSSDAYYAEVARGVLDYVLRSMTDRDGGFYSAEDADSVIDPAEPQTKGEGAYYIWTQAEIEAALGQAAAQWFCYAYGIEEHGNVRDDPHAEFAGKNILWEAHTADETAAHFEKPSEDIRASLEASRRSLIEARGARVRPGLDDKVLTSWNGLMISAFAKGAQVLEESRYLQAAQNGANFLLARMWDADRGVLARRYREGDVAVDGFLDDYAFFAQGLLDLYETDFDARWLDAAIRLTDQMLARFEDRERGGFFSTAAGCGDLILRMKDDYDGAEPSGNSIAALNLLRLERITGRAEYRAAAERTFQAFASRMVDAAIGVPQMLAAYEFAVDGAKEIVIAGSSAARLLRPTCTRSSAAFCPTKSFCSPAPKPLATRPGLNP